MPVWIRLADGPGPGTAPAMLRICQAEGNDRAETSLVTARHGPGHRADRAAMIDTARTGEPAGPPGWAPRQGTWPASASRARATVLPQCVLIPAQSVPNIHGRHGQRERHYGIHR
jgi:hypothetical protein